MGLADIAAGIETTAEQRDAGVATVDDVGDDLADRLTDYAATLPCSASTAAEVVEAYAAGRSVGDAGVQAGLPPTTAAKVLHRLGLEGLSPLSPQGREIVRDWLDARLSRSEARELTGADEVAFELAVYIETHDPLPGARAAIEPALALDGDATTAKRDLLADTIDSCEDLHGL